MPSKSNALLLAAALLLTFAVPALAAEEPSKPGIPWIEELTAAWKQAVGDKKPLVVYFHPHRSPGKDYRVEHPWCARLEEEVLCSERFNALAGRAVFAWIDGEIDDTKGNVSRLQKGLDVDRYPVVTVLDVTADKIAERGKIIGYLPQDEYMTKIAKLLGEAPGGERGTPPDAGSAARPKEQAAQSPPFQFRPGIDDWIAPGPNNFEEIYRKRLQGDIKPDKPAPSEPRKIPAP